MVGRIIEVASTGAHISVERGFMKVSRDREILGQIPLDDIDALVVHAHGATFSANLVTRLAERGAPLVMCGSNHTPIALVWPMDGHHEQGFRMQAQARAKKPLLKRVWRDLVRAKIRAQSGVLRKAGLPTGLLDRLEKRVRSGDSENLEARAAQYYWPKLMGDEFRRDRRIEGTNALLNYGYMVLRAATARSIIAAGLHPSLSIHHKSRGTALRLADDLMEPFRPYVDLTVKRLIDADSLELDRDTKSELAAITTLDLEGAKGASPIQNCLDNLAISLAQTYQKKRKTIELPGPLHKSGAKPI